MLAYASFPFLEGVVRQECREYIAPGGEVLKSFKTSDGVLYGPRTAGRSRGKHVKTNCSSLAHGLDLLETVVSNGPLSQRLSRVRKKVKEGDVGTDTKKVSGDERDLYNIMYIHRNSNLHGGGHVVHVGLAALLMATMIMLDHTRDHYEQYRDTALEISHMSPLDPEGEWFHLVYYPVRFFNAGRPRNVHCWTEIQRVRGSSAT